MSVITASIPFGQISLPYTPIIRVDEVFYSIIVKAYDYKQAHIN